MLLLTEIRSSWIRQRKLLIGSKIRVILVDRIIGISDIELSGMLYFLPDYKICCISDLN